MLDIRLIRKTLFCALLVSMLPGCTMAPADPAQNDARALVDMIAGADYVLTMVPGEAVIRDGAIVVNKGEILEVGDAATIRAKYRASESLPGAGRILMPGLINGHTHAAMSLLRGIADDLPLQEWLERYIFPAEVQFVDETFVRVGTELACYEMIRGGTTTFVDMYYFPDAVAETVVQCGMRAIVVPSVIDQVAPDAGSGEQSLQQAIDFAIRWQGRNSRVVPSIGGHAIYTLAPATLAKIRDAAAELEVPVGIHLEESQFEMAFSDQQYGMTPVAFLEDMDFFKNKVIGAHVVYPSVADQKILAQRRVGAIHNPTSNMKISSGISPVTLMLEAGVPMGLGTDGAASNNDLDMWEEIRLASFLQKIHTMNPQSLPAYTVLDMATRSGAEAIGLGGVTGALRPGLRADFIRLSIDELTAQPLYDPVSHLAYVADEHDVTDVVIDGRMVMRDGEVLTIDAVRLRTEVDSISAKISAELIGQ